MANDHSDSEFAEGLWKQLVGNVSALNFDNFDSVSPWNQWGASTSNHNIVATHIGFPDSDSVAPWNKWGAGTSNHNVVASGSSQPVEREWVLLPEFIVKLILDKLLESIDHVRFAAVCKRWYNLTKDYTERWYDRVRPPMLMLPPPNTQTPTRTLYSVSQGVTYNNIQFQLPAGTMVEPYYSTETYGCGSCGHGWLANVIVEMNYRKTQPREGFEEWHLELINPFRPATISDLHIPPVKLHHDGTSPKVILSADPTLNPNNFWVLAFSINGSNFALYDRGHRRWITPISEREAVFIDAIFYGEQFYVLDKIHGTIVSFDVEKAQVNCLRINNRKAFFGHAYLVKSTKGDLLYLQRIVTSKRIGGVLYKLTKSFKVYKLVFDNRSSSHVDRVQVKNIGDDVFFVGDTPSVAVFAPNFPGCQPNSIYYTDDWINKSKIFKRQKQNILWDMGIFNLADQTIRHYHLAGEHAHLPPLWITPPLPFDPPEKEVRFDPIPEKEARKQQIRRKARHLWLSCFRTKE